MYLLASLNEKEITTDPETGEEVESYNYRDTILRVNLETGEAVELCCPLPEEFQAQLRKLARQV